MSHHTIKSSYMNLTERINRFPQGAPPSETLYKILKILFSQREAELVAMLPIKPFTVKEAARIWKMDEASARKIMDELASRAILMDADYNGVQKYVLPPPMAGFFEFALMRMRGDIDQKVLSELYYQYLNVEEDFIRDLFAGTETQLGRVFVQEDMLPGERGDSGASGLVNATYVLDFERASHIIKTATDMGVGMCYCRHKMQHLGKVCDAPMDICMTFGGTANSLIRYEYARKVDAVEGMELLHQAYEHNLVQFGENVRNDISFICNCCGCCCEALIAARKFGMLHPVHTSNYLPKVNNESCIGCGKCIKACPVEAISYAPEAGATKPSFTSGSGAVTHPNGKKAVVDEEICLGCGICARACPIGSITLERRKQQVITPVNSVHRLVLMAIEKGKLQNLIFDNQAFASHRAMAAVLGVILKLPPVKQIMASKQMKSVYLERLASRAKL